MTDLRNNNAGSGEFPGFAKGSAEKPVEVLVSLAPENPWYGNRAASDDKDDKALLLVAADMDEFHMYYSGLLGDMLGKTVKGKNDVESVYVFGPASKGVPWLKDLCTENGVLYGTAEGFMQPWKEGHA